MSPKILLQSNEDVTVKNTVSLVTLFQGPIPANVIDGDHGIRITMFGQYINSTAGDHNANLYIGIGSNLTVVTFPIVIPLVGSGAIYEAIWSIFAKGSLSAQEGFGRFLSSEIGTAAKVQLAMGAATEDATEDLDLTIRVGLDFASNAFQWIKSKVVVELL